MHLNSYPDDRLKPCCMSDKYFKDTDLKKFNPAEAFNSPEYREWRLDLINGKKNKLCSSCWEQEAMGAVSTRMSTNEIWSDHIDSYLSKVQEDGYIEPNFLFLDLRPSNICNLKCRTCSSDFSSRWIEEENKFNDKFDLEMPKGTIRVTNLNFPIETLTNLNKIYFAGGEPLYMDSMYEFIERIPNKENVQLFFQTNFMYTKYKGVSIFDSLIDFNKVTYNISIDGVGDLVEYIRTGFKWSKFISNMNELLEMEKFSPNKFDHNFQFTYSIFNCFHFYEFRSKLYELGFMRSDDDIITFPVKYPSFQNVNRYTIKTEAGRYLESKLDDIKTDQLRTHIENLIKHTYANAPFSGGSSKKELKRFLKFGNSFNNTILPSNLLYLNNLISAD